MAGKVAHGVEEGAKYVKTAVEYGKKVYNVLQKVSTGVDAAEKMGVIKQDSAIAKGNALFKMLSGSGFPEAKYQHTQVFRKRRSY